MNGYGFSLILIIMVTGLIGALIWLSSRGNVEAMIVLASITVLTLVLVGALLTLAVVNSTDNREHNQAMERMRNQIDMAMATNALIDNQNKQVIAMTGGNLKKLSAPKDEIIDIDATLFSDFDEVAK